MDTEHTEYHVDRGHGVGEEPSACTVDARRYRRKKRSLAPENCSGCEAKKLPLKYTLKSSLLKHLPILLGSLSKNQPPPQKSTNSHLPTEIILQILSYLALPSGTRIQHNTHLHPPCAPCSLSDLFSCSLISRAWTAPANQFLYSTLLLDLVATCERHCRGDPLPDNAYRWAQRNDYLRLRYLQPLLRTLSENPELGKRFRIAQVKLYHCPPDDFGVIPLYRKILALCPNLERIDGDTCILFRTFKSSDDPRFSRRLANIASLGITGKLVRRRVLHAQKKLWDVLAAHESWKSWEWCVADCHVTLHVKYREKFIALHSKWEKLEHLSLKGFQIQEFIPGDLPPILAPLHSLRSLELYRTETRAVLPAIASNKLEKLILRCYPGAGDMLQQLWLYLHRSAIPPQRKTEPCPFAQKRLRPAISNLKKIGLEIPNTSLGTTKKIFDTLFTLAPNLEIVTLSNLWALDPLGHIAILADNSYLDARHAGWDILPTSEWIRINPCLSSTNTQNVRQMKLMFPGVSHAELITQIMENTLLFPNLERLEVLAMDRNMVVIELREVDVAGQWENLERCTEGFAKVEAELSAVLEKRGLKCTQGEQELERWVELGEVFGELDSGRIVRRWSKR